jgi:hypothetical protein
METKTTQKSGKGIDSIGKEYTDEDLEGHYEFAEKDQRFHSFWRPVIGGLTFGIGGALLVLAAVFGWTYYLLHQGSTIFVWGMIIGAIILLLGVAWTS